MVSLEQKWVLDPGFHRDPELAQEINRIQTGELGNGSYIEFDIEEWDGEEDFPVITKMLKEKGVTECIILIWW